MSTAAPLAFLSAVEAGLPVAALDALVRAVAPDDSQFRYRLVPKATLTRRARVSGVQGGFQERQAPFAAPSRATARLTPEESGRVGRLQRVWDAALDVWGTPDTARAFLFRPHPLLEGRKPMDVVLASEFGGPVVEHILGALKYGSAA